MIAMKAHVQSFHLSLTGELFSNSFITSSAGFLAALYESDTSGLISPEDQNLITTPMEQ